MGGEATTTTTIPVALPPPHLITDGGEARQPGKANNPMYGRTGTLNPMYGRTGTLNYMYGIVPTNAMTINVNSPDGKLIQSFSSQVAAANWLNTSRRTISR